jgi:hypothetical protein
MVKSVVEDIAAEIARLQSEAASCRACDLWKTATHTVFGVLFVGEQPGDREFSGWTPPSRCSLGSAAWSHAAVRASYRRGCQK